MTKQLAGKVAVVTGASRGIGYEFAKVLAGQGAHIIAVARTSGGLEELDDEINSLGSSATLVPVNLRDFPAIDRLGAAIHERWGKLDILVGNAGMLGGLSPLGHYKPQVFQDVLALNLTANWRLIRSLDPLLKQAEFARAVFLTSGAARTCNAYWGPYAASKAGLDAMIKVYARECQITSIRANLLSPGLVASNMQAEAFPGKNPEELTSPAEVAAAALPMCLQSNEANGEIFQYEDGKVSIL